MIKPDLTGRRVLITGGTQGIGLATGLAFGQCGATCALTYRWGSVSDEEVKAKFAAVGAPEPILVQADVGDDDDTAALLAALKGQWSGVDVYVANASNALRIGSLDDYTLRGLDKSIKNSVWPLISYTKAIHATFGAYPKYVVAMSSDGPDHYSIGYDFVAATKALLETFTRYLSYRLLEHGTKVNAIRSRSVKTESFDSVFGQDLRQFGLRFATEEHFVEPSEVAGAALALCSGWLDAVNGQVITVDRGTAFSDNLMRLFTERDKLSL